MHPGRSRGSHGTAGSRLRLALAARVGMAVVLSATFIALGAAPAGAHGVAGAQPTDWASRVRSVTPTVAGLHVSVRDLGARIEVRNDTAYDVVIFGYEGEPYLRVGPRGVYENRRSPSLFVNRTKSITAATPPSYDAHAAPEWRRVGGGHSVSWHDHRVHWMSASEPPVVRDSPGRVHLISNWVVALQYRGQDVAVRGDLRWVPGPSAAPRLLLALLFAVVVIGLGFTRRWAAVLVVTLVGLAAVVGILIGGEWAASSSGPWRALLATVYSVLGFAVALAAAGALVRSRRAPEDATAIVLVAAVILTFGSGLADIAYLGRSQLPTTLPGALARTCVAIVLGASFGVLVTAVRKLRRPAVLAIPAADGLTPRTSARP